MRYSRIKARIDTVADDHLEAFKEEKLKVEMEIERLKKELDAKKFPMLADALETRVEKKYLPGTLERLAMKLQQEK